MESHPEAPGSAVWCPEMLIDKRMAGLALVSLILATLIMITIARENVEAPIEVFQNEFPPQMASGRSTFRFALVARESFENVQIRFSILWEKSPEFKELVDPGKEFNTSSKAEDVLDNIVKLSWLRNETSLLRIEPEVFDLTVNLGDGAPDRILIHDYSSIIDSLSGRQAMLGAPLTYAAILDENGEEYYMEGASGFFVNPTENVLSLMISRNDQEQNYFPIDQIWEGSNRLPIQEAPEGGILDYADVEKDDRFNVIFTTENRDKPPGFGFVLGPDKKDFGYIQMIRVYLDGELYDQPILNVVTR
jgi:hypothetical protein